MARPPSSEVGDEKLRPDTPDFSMPTDGPKATQAVRPADPPALATGSAPPSLSSCAVGSGAGTALDPGCIGDAGSLGVPMEVEPLWGAAFTSAFEGDEITEAFVPRVYAALEVEPESRGRFDSTMAAFRDRRADTAEVMQSVSGLLAERNLLSQFNSFLSEGYRIETLPSVLSAYRCCYIEPSAVTSESAEVLAAPFVDRVVERFADRPALLDEIFQTLSAASLDDPSMPLTLANCTRAPQGTTKVYTALRRLLSSESDLLREFMQYVPASCTNLLHVHTVST